MKKIVVFMLGLLGVVIVAGCYTVLVHPRVEGTEDHSYRTRYCSDCHGSADFYYWHWPYYDRWYWRYPHWRSYYCNPWWWDDYWYWRGDSGGTGYQEPRYFEERLRPATPILPGGSVNVGEDKKSQKDAPGGERKTGEEQGKKAPRYFEERKRPATPNKTDSQKNESSGSQESKDEDKNSEEDKQ